MVNLEMRRCTLSAGWDERGATSMQGKLSQCLTPIFYSIEEIRIIL